MYPNDIVNSVEYCKLICNNKKTKCFIHCLQSKYILSYKNTILYRIFKIYK